MKKSFKSVVAVIMCLTIIFTSAFSVSAASADETDRGTQFLSSVVTMISNGLNKLADSLLSGLSDILPATVKIKDPSTHVTKNFYEGNSKFLDEPAENAQWNLGYASASILPDDFSEGKYYKGGYDINMPLGECLDDLKVRVIVIDDASGRGKSVFAVVDCIGLANEDVRNIRAALADYAKQNNIVSINISATHTHSGIDTQGIYTDTFNHVFKNLFSAIIGIDFLADPVDTKFLDTIKEKTVACVKEATESMKSGTLTFAKADILDYVRDRTDPEIMLDYLYRLMFKPDDGSKGTIIANYGVHPEAAGYSTKIITSDFVYYTEEVVNNAGYNFMFIQGAVGTYTESHGMSNDGIEGLDRLTSTIRYGEEIGYILLGMTESEEYCKKYIVDEEREALAANSDSYTLWCEDWTPAEEKVVEPILNIKLVEYLAPVENGVYRAFGKLSLANNVMYQDENGDIVTSTEVGYMELGKDIKIILCPGETYAELIKGGENMDSFKYDCAEKIMKEDENDEILVFDLMNDALGYIMADDDFVYFRLSYDGELDIGDSWGLTSIGKHAASNIYGEIYKLYESVK